MHLNSVFSENDKNTESRILLARLWVSHVLRFGLAKLC